MVKEDMKLIIDTDTAGDDVNSLLFGLLWPGVDLVAITTSFGNVPIDLCTKNALITVEKVGRENEVPVYRGAEHAIMREQINSDYVHGDDGMGNSFFPDPETKERDLHGANALVKYINENPGEITVVAQGPLTNVALAYLLDPSIVDKVKHVYVMGGSVNYRGNVSPAAEYNFFADPEAASIVFQSGMPLTMVGWEICNRYGVVGGEDLEELRAIDTDIADFYHKVNSATLEFNITKNGMNGVSHPDSMTCAIAINDAVMTKSEEYYVDIDTQSDQRRGFSDVDTRPSIQPNPFVEIGEPNARVCLEADYELFFSMLKAVLSNDFSEFED